MIRALPDGFELDDDPARVDLDEVHRFLSTEAYWALGRSRETVERLVGEAQRVVGLYQDGRQVGFCRAFTDGVSIAYLADVYVLPELRGRGLGVELVREMVENSALHGREVAPPHDRRARPLRAIRVRPAGREGDGAAPVACPRRWQRPTYQDMIRALEGYWADQDCVLMQPYHTEVGAGTFNPATALRSLGPAPWRAAYVEPSIRPTDGRYGENPFRFQHYFQYQVLLKPSPDERPRAATSPRSRRSGST